MTRLMSCFPLHENYLYLLYIRLPRFAIHQAMHVSATNQAVPFTSIPVVNPPHNKWSLRPVENHNAITGSDTLQREPKPTLRIVEQPRV